LKWLRSFIELYTLSTHSLILKLFKNVFKFDLRLKNMSEFKQQTSCSNSLTVKKSCQMCRITCTIKFFSYILHLFSVLTKKWFQDYWKLTRALTWIIFDRKLKSRYDTHQNNQLIATNPKTNQKLIFFKTNVRVPAVTFWCFLTKGGTLTLVWKQINFWY